MTTCRWSPRFTDRWTASERASPISTLLLPRFALSNPAAASPASSAKLHRRFPTEIFPGFLEFIDCLQEGINSPGRIVRAIFRRLPFKWLHEIARWLRRIIKSGSSSAVITGQILNRRRNDAGLLHFPIRTPWVLGFRVFREFRRCSAIGEFRSGRVESRAFGNLWRIVSGI